MERAIEMNEIRPLGEAELDYVNGGYRLVDIWVVVPKPGSDTHAQVWIRTAT
jgi:hypothetical protein